MANNNPYASDSLLEKLLGVLSPNAAEAFYAGPKAQEWESGTPKFTGKYDKKPRFEIDDSNAKISMPSVDSGGTAILGEVLDHKELYKNYPYFADIPVELIKDYDSKGSFDGHKIRIRAELSDEEKQNTLFHEVQHAIQDYEGFAQGGGLFSKTFNDANLKTFKKFAEIDLSDHLKALSSPFTNPYSGKTTYVVPRTLHSYNPFGILFENHSVKDSKYIHMPHDMESEKELLARVDTLKTRIKQADDLLEKYRVSGSPSIDESYDFYRNLAGEIEARDVPTRIGYNANQRQTIAPYSSENIPESEAFVLY